MLPLILAWLIIALIALIVFMAIFFIILWFVKWLPATFGWVGILLCACGVCYIFYKYV